VVEVAQARPEEDNLQDDDGMMWQVRPHVRGHSTRALRVGSHTTARAVRDSTYVPSLLLPASTLPSRV
jgi:hypothetical protein